jgi:hypothetical protein
MVVTVPTNRTTTSRGYGGDHKAERERWRPVVEAGQAQCAAVTCLEPSRDIAPDAAWDLDHNDARTGYRGPAHALCNRSAGGVAAAAKNNAARGMTIRQWGDPA